MGEVQQFCIKHRETIIGTASFLGRARAFEITLAVIYTTGACADDEATIALARSHYLRNNVSSRSKRQHSCFASCSNYPHKTASPASFVHSQSSSRDIPIRLADLCPKKRWMR